MGEEAKKETKKEIPIVELDPKEVFDPKQVEELVIELAKKGYPMCQIGLILRDKYGIPDVRKITGKKISKILQENNLLPDIPDDLRALMKRAVRVIKHLEKHPKDMHSKRGLMLIESKIHRLICYYKEKGRLPPEFKYSRETAEMYIR